MILPRGQSRHLAASRPRTSAAFLVALGLGALATSGCGSTTSSPGFPGGDDASPGSQTGEGTDGATTTPVDAATTPIDGSTPRVDATTTTPVDAAAPSDARAPADAGGPVTSKPDGAVAVMDAAAEATAPVATDGAPGCGGSVFGGGPDTTSATHLDIGVHDPSMIWDGQKYFLFATGGTLNVRSSTNILTWTNAGNIFTAIPAAITTALGSPPADLWAPDISYFNGQFHVYYAGSTFGSNDSAIGLATTASLETPRWTDDGVIVATKTTDNFNAIDPNVSFDQSCTPWLAFGSFWDGIKMRKLDPTTGNVATDDTTLYSLASRNGGAIEAASIISHNGFYYLFVSFDLCCQGVNSTYRTMVGRAPAITGPYTNKAGTSMMQGAAEQLLVTSGRYIGPGGGTAWKNGNTYLYVYHYYDGQANGASKLQVRPITFDATDWIVLGDPLFP
jgi:arabinan endo-1,5-alpha-L-arabinosidase